MARILHLIDSLAPGGAERVAVNLVNELNKTGHTVWLCATRAAGILLDQIEHRERYALVKKHSTLDFRAFLKLIHLVRREKIAVIHAHSSSIYWAMAVKWCTGCKVVWHDHNGHRPHTSVAQKWLLKLTSLSMDAACCVSEDLANWSKENLWISRHKVFKINNFTVLNPKRRMLEKSAVTILCVANLREEKDHLNLLTAVNILKEDFSPTEVQLCLVGENTGHYYEKVLHPTIVDLEIQLYTKYAGAQTDISTWLFSADIGVLSSRWEGLPLALLEYGLAGLAVVCTDTGACREVLGDGRYGLLVPPADPVALANALHKLLTDKQLRQQLGDDFAIHARDHYGPAAVMPMVEKIYRQVLA